MNHPVQVNADQTRVQGVDHVVKVQQRIAQENGAEVDDPDVVSPVAEESLQRLESDGEILIEGRDWNVAAGAKERKIDVRCV